MLADLLRRFFRGREGNVAITFALALVPAIFLIGMGLDFSGAIQKRSKLNAAADAAALSAVTPSMMAQSATAAKTAATNMFGAVAAGATGITNVNPTISISSSTSGLTRTAVVSYTAGSVNNFPNFLGQTNWSISGTSTATATTPPNIDFYLLLDNSPSMDLPATSAGITAMINATKNAPSNGANDNGCAFACHESNPSADNLGNPNGIDNYQLAINLGVTTRMQNLNSATQSLMTTASQMEQQNNVTCPGSQGCYRMAIYTFNTGGINTIQTLTSNLTTAQNSAKNIDVLLVCQNNYLTCNNNNNDTDTDFSTAMSQIYKGPMTTNGPSGTGSSTSTPQQVLFLVSDGVDDNNSGTCNQPLDGTRCQQPFSTTWCTTMKNKGILVAVLYTAYLPLPASGVGSNSWYNEWVAPFQSQIGPNMQSCASPGLYFQVTTDGDIAAAMQTLFQQAVATARLSN
jgi:Flp pilus assembly protein TadG